MRKSHGIDVPDEADLMHLKEAVDRLYAKRGRDPTQQELADALGITKAMTLEWLMWYVAGLVDVPKTDD